MERYPYITGKCSISLMTRYLDVGLGERGKQWHPRLPDLILQDFFFWKYVKEKFYILPLPTEKFMN
jgi:hypothetical protein